MRLIDSVAAGGPPVRACRYHPGEPHRHTVTTDRASIAADYAGLLQPGGSSMLEGDERRPGVPRHIAREAGRLIVQRGVGDGTHELGEGWTMRGEGERVRLLGGVR